MTYVRQSPKLGARVLTVGEHDATKIWKASMQLEETLGHVKIRFDGNEWRYYYNSCSLMKRKLQR